MHTMICFMSTSDVLQSSERIFQPCINTSWGRPRPEV
uniref:Uncharacterized protein n=1 Tax=Arundo donax TaxID=35708 RepID=A0A0A8YSL5_ARUDO